MSDRTVRTVIIHSDGSYKRENCTAGFGYRIKSNRGEKLVEGFGYAPNATTSMHAESVGLLTAIQTAKRFSPDHVVVYSDCESLAHTVSPRHTAETNDRVVQKIKHELQPIRDVSVNYTPRDNNKRAHDLASKGLRVFTKSEDVDLLPTSS